MELSGVETRRIELEPGAAVQRFVDEVEPELVVHAAGMTSVEACERDPALARHVNVDLAVHVARACAQFGVRFVQISTDHLFSSGRLLVDEDQPVSPTNVYGQTKAEAERQVLEANPRALVVRTNFYGWGPSYRPSFSDAIISALRSADPITLFQDVFFNPILCEVLVKAVHDLVDSGASGIFHVVGDDRVSKYEFGLRVAAQFGLDAAPIRAGNLTDRADLVRRPHEMSLSNRQACRLLGRSLGGVSEHVQRLWEQERIGLAHEVAQI
jgi:dTDP-4-dehydrorhamnose reductase